MYACVVWTGRFRAGIGRRCGRAIGHSLTVLARLTVVVHRSLAKGCCARNRWWLCNKRFHIWKVQVLSHLSSRLVSSFYCTRFSRWKLVQRLKAAPPVWLLCKYALNAPLYATHSFVQRSIRKHARCAILPKILLKSRLVFGHNSSCHVKTDRWRFTFNCYLQTFIHMKCRLNVD